MYTMTVAHMQQLTQQKDDTSCLEMVDACTGHHSKTITAIKQSGPSLFHC